MPLKLGAREFEARSSVSRARKATALGVNFGGDLPAHHIG
jgi:hypothetical protein